MSETENYLRALRIELKAAEEACLESDRHFAARELEKLIRKVDSKLAKKQMALEIPEARADAWIPEVVAFFDRFQIKNKVLNSWLVLFKDPKWIAEEVLKANAWLTVNPERMPIKMDRFLANWLIRGWERYRRTLKSLPPGERLNTKALTQDELEGM